jgi:outer membrane protein assembly factor BamB
MARALAIAMLGCAALLTMTAAPARAGGGDLLWQVRFPGLGVDGDHSVALAATNKRVVVAGMTTTPAGPRLEVQVHRAKTGALLWTDDVDLTGPVVVMDDQRVVVAGGRSGAMGTGLIRTYDAETGELTWTDAWPGGVRGLFKEGSRIVVTGFHGETAGPFRFHVRSYVARTGAMAWTWTDLLPLPPGYSHAVLGATAIVGDTLFVAGEARRSGPIPGTECLIRAHHLVTGILLWQTIHDLSDSGFCFPASIAADRRRVVVGGVGGGVLDDYFVLAVDADTGEFAWQDHQRVGANRIDFAAAIDTLRHRTFVVGWISIPTPGALGGVLEAYVVRSYETDTGFLRWHDELTGPVPIEWRGFDVEAKSGHIFAVGTNMVSGLWLVRSYDASDGRIRWEDEFLPGDGVGDVRDANTTQMLALDGGRMFVVGSGFNADGGVDIILRAYDAK